MTHRRFALTSLLPFAFEPAEIGASVSRTIAFRNATVIDGSRAVLPDHTIVIREDRVIGLGPSASIAIPSGTSLVDARGRFIIPGLWDAHAHVSYFKASSLPVLLANGVTSIRDMGGLLGELDRWRTQTDAGLRPGPRIYRAGPILNGKAFNEFQIAVNNSGEAAGAVHALANAGVDFIKVHAAILRDAYFGVQRECRSLHLPCAGHMPRDITPEEASGAGQLTLEHAGACADRFASAGTPDDRLAERLARFRREDAPRLFERFARNRTWFTPALIASKTAIHLADHKPDLRDKYVSASCKRTTQALLRRPGYQSFFTAESVKNQTRQFEQLLPLVNLMHRSGVRLLAGSDFAVSFIYPGFSIHEEMELLVLAGLTPMQAILAATANPAEVLGQHDLGTLKTGNHPDFVVLEADPLADIRNTRKIAAVVSRGRVFNRSELDRMLANAAEEAART